MAADLDILCIAVYCTADDLLPSACPNARRLRTETDDLLHHVLGLDP
jgi:hypothetical protein